MIISVLLFNDLIEVFLNLNCDLMLLPKQSQSHIQTNNLQNSCMFVAHLRLMLVVWLLNSICCCFLLLNLKLFWSPEASILMKVGLILTENIIYLELHKICNHFTFVSLRMLIKCLLVKLK